MQKVLASASSGVLIVLTTTYRLVARHRWRAQSRLVGLGTFAIGTAMLSGAASVTTVAQTTNADTSSPSFQVASIKPNNSAAVAGLTIQQLPGGRIEAENVSLHELIVYAYGLKSYQAPIEGKTELLKQGFDVSARAPEDVPRAPRLEVGPLNRMMQRLLAERLGLIVRWEERSQTGYVLLQHRPGGPLGPGLRASQVDCSGQTGFDATGTCRSLSGSNKGDYVEYTATGHPLSALTTYVLERFLISPVLDQTNLHGPFEVRLTIEMKDVLVFLGERNRGNRDAAPPRSVFKAVEDQLGLRLEPQRVMVPTLVVERVELPSQH